MAVSSRKKVQVLVCLFIAQRFSTDVTNVLLWMKEWTKILFKKRKEKKN